jgi:hypothetical protein
VDSELVQCHFKPALAGLLDEPLGGCPAITERLTANASRLKPADNCLWGFADHRLKAGGKRRPAKAGQNQP